MYRYIVLFSFIFCAFTPTKGQVVQLQRGNMLAVTHYLFPSICYAILPQVCNQKEAHEKVTISDLETGALIFDSPMILMSMSLDRYIPVAEDFEIEQVTIQDQQGVLYYKSHSLTEKIQLTNLAAGTYILSGINEHGDVARVLFTKA